MTSGRREKFGDGAVVPPEQLDELRQVKDDLVVSFYV
jgi:hypothetical protein